MPGVRKGHQVKTRLSGVVSGMLVGDMHYTHTPPSSRTAGYADEIGLALDAACRRASRESCSFGAILGDLTHRKGRTTHAEVIALAKILRRGLDTVGLREWETVPGNHDMIGHDINGAGLAQPIGVLEQAGLIHRADLEPRVVVSGDAAVAVCAVPFSVRPPTLDDFARFVEPVYDGFKGRLTGWLFLLHHDLQANSAALSSVVRALGELSEKTGAPAVAANGHLHADNAAAKLADGRKQAAFVNVGSLVRTSIADRDYQTRAVVVRFDASTPGIAGVSFQSMPLPAVSPDTFVADAPPDPDSEVKDLAEFLGALDAASPVTSDPLAGIDEIAARLSIRPEAVVAARALVGEHR